MGDGRPAGRRQSATLGVETEDTQIGNFKLEMVPQRILGQQQRGAGVLEYESQSLSGIGRVNGHVSRGRFEDGQEADHHGGRPFDANAHERFRAGAQILQLTGQRLGTLVQLLVREPVGSTNQRRGLRRALDLRLEKLMDAGVPGIIGGGIVPFDHDLVPFPFAQQGEIVERSLGMADTFGQHLFELAQQTQDRRVVEQFRAVITIERQALVGFRHVEVDVEIGEATWIAGDGSGQPVEIQRAPCPADVEGHVGQRHSVWVAGEVQFADEAAERKAMMFKRLEHARAERLQIIAELLPRVDSAAQRQQICAVTHQVLRPGRELTCGGRAHHDVILTAQPVQKHVEGREQRSEGCAVVRGTEALHGRHQVPSECAEPM